MYWSRKFKLTECKDCNYIGVRRNNRRHAEKYICADGSQNPVHMETRCPSGSECVAPNTISFDSCGVNAWTCQESH